MVPVLVHGTTGMEQVPNNYIHVFTIILVGHHAHQGHTGISLKNVSVSLCCDAVDLT